MNELNQTSAQAEAVADGIKVIGDQAKDTQADLEELGSKASAAFSLIFQVVKDSINTLNTYNESMVGLRSTAEEMAMDFAELKGAADTLAADGLMSVADAATSMNNLLQTGFNLDETVAIIERLKDAAAYGRDEASTFGEAVRSATEGIQSGNSILVNDCPLAA
jgi:hypothetical protein